MSSLRSRSSSRTMSSSVRQLQDMLNIHLNTSEKADFLEVLNQFHINRDVPLFVKNLKLLLNSPAKQQLFPLIKKVIPKIDLEEFEQCLKPGSRKFDTMPAKQSKKLQRSRPPLSSATVSSKSMIPKSKKRKKEKSGTTRSRNTSESSNTSKSFQSVKSIQKDTRMDFKSIRMQSDPSGRGFGFSIRGGAEFGIGIYVSTIEDDGMAQKHGLTIGDRLVEVNDVAFDKITHHEAAKIIKSSSTLAMKINRVGRIPGSFVVHQMYQWVNEFGRAVSPPPENQHLREISSGGPKSGFHILQGADERKISMSIEKEENLGVMIRGGREFGLGIYVSGVDPLSVADKSGMKVGDQILDVNGVSFLDITHPDAVQVLKTSKHLMCTIKDVGKLPYGRTKIDQTSWVSNELQRKRHNSQNSDSTMTRTSSRSSMFRKGIGSQLMYNTAISTKWDTIENQAVELLNEGEQGTLRYYLNEYQAGFITVDGLVMASFELLNTQAKMRMMPEIRNWVRSHDLDKFDMLLDRREAQERQIVKGFHGYSTDDETGHNFRLQKSRVRSAPTSRAATLREKSTRVRKQVAEWELEPLRQAIEQIEIDSDYSSGNMHGHVSRKMNSSRQRSNRSAASSPNLHKTMLMKRSMSEETLTPVYIDLSSDLPSSLSHRASPRPRSNSASTRNRYIYNQSNRLYPNNSQARRRHRSVEDLRIAAHKKKRTPDSSRRSSVSHSRGSLASSSYSLIPDTEPKVVHADVHHQPRLIDGSPSDDSGVEVNGHAGNDISLNRTYSTNFSLRQKRVTISADNPVNIDDVLQSRSSYDLGSHSNHSTLTNHSSRSRSSVNTLTNRNSVDRDSNRTLSSHGNWSTDKSGSWSLLTPEIRVNDGEGSIDTISLSSDTSPRFKRHPRQRKPVYDTDDEDDDDDDDHMYMIGDEVRDNSDLYVSPLDRVLDEEDSFLTDVEAQLLDEARRKYGNIPLKIISIYKTKPTLGMAIEGGANTRQPVPRVINLQPGGSAYESGGLKIGHVILEVNGHSLVGLEHITAAKSLAEAFKNTDQDNMELLVTESDVNIKIS